MSILQNGGGSRSDLLNSKNSLEQHTLMINFVRSIYALSPNIVCLLTHPKKKR